ncbi:major facilitator superfamily domain-containing protein [Chaetomium fimeti]|uniref:Major facilitator superfamily domain-containing protein n=1 Tax=Chaetomium fimeti TaxID=1854472 RepID=A0AAE0HD84_9PEZI|nr:major facilitator superfamily domain-containing protein [Chaetomium fimeti]
MATLAEHPSTLASGAPPDGGWAAWMSVLAGFLAIMNTWGLVISFGVFQTYHVTNLHRPPSDISWIGSIAVFLLFFGGVVSGRLTDAGYFRSTISTGAFLIVLGTFMTSLSETYWQLVLAQGVCIGVGNGLLLTPVSAVISTYFSTKLPLVMGIAACGSVTGGLIYPSMARTLLGSVGFGWTMRAIGFIQLDTLAVAVAVITPRLAPKWTGALLDLSAFKEPEFVLNAIGSFLAFLGVFVPFFYLSSYARSVQGMEYTESLDLLLVLNGVGFVGRLLPGFVARYVGTLNVFLTSLLLSALAMYAWIAVHSTPGLYAWTSFYSIFVGGVQSLLPAAISVLNPDLQKLGSRMGMIFAAVGIGALIGSPIAGILISERGGSYVGAQAFSGSSLVVGALLIFAAQEVGRRRKKAV